MARPSPTACSIVSYVVVFHVRDFGCVYRGRGALGWRFASSLRMARPVGVAHGRCLQAAAPSGGSRDRRRAPRRRDIASISGQTSSVAAERAPGKPQKDASLVERLAHGYRRSREGRGTPLLVRPEEDSQGIGQPDCLPVFELLKKSPNHRRSSCLEPRGKKTTEAKATNRDTGGLPLKYDGSAPQRLGSVFGPIRKYVYFAHADGAKFRNNHPWLECQLYRFTKGHGQRDRGGL